MAEASGPLHATLATVRQTNAYHVSALDALERAFSAETAHSFAASLELKRPERAHRG